MPTQQNLALDDPHARTQSEGLEVVYASASGSERFDRDSLFGGFTSMRALTYTPSIPMIMALLRDYDCEVTGRERKRHSYVRPQYHVFAPTPSVPFVLSVVN